MRAADLLHLIQIARGLLQRAHARQRHQGVDLIEAQLNATQRGNVIHHHRQTIGGINDCPIVIAMLIKTERIVKRRNRGNRIVAVTAGSLGELLALSGADGAHMGNQRDFSFGFFSHDFQHFLTFGNVLDKRLAGRTADIQPVDPLFNVKPHQTAQAFRIQSLLAIEWRKQCGHNPF